MTKKLSRPLIPKIKHEKATEKALDNYFYKTLYAPLIDITRKLKYYDNNVNDDVLIAAIKEGRIQYVDGMFIGRFNVKISKALQEMGAVYSKRRKAWIIEQSRLPVKVIAATAASSLYWETVRAELLDFLNKVDTAEHIPNLKELLKIPIEKTFDDLDEQMQKKVIKNMAIEPTLTPYVKEQMTERWVSNTELSVKNFADTEVKRLRELVQTNLFEGLQSNKSLMAAIEKEFNVTSNKAKFLARNETGNLISEYNLSRAKEIGLKQYVWVSMEDVRVRPMHAELNGKIIDFDNPPIVNKKGERKHAGADYNCRCRMQMIIE